MALLPPIDSPELDHAVAEAVRERFGYLLLPAVDDAAAIQHIDVLLTVAEARAGLSVGRTRIIAKTSDTAAGTLYLTDLRRVSARLEALAFDATALLAVLAIAKPADRGEPDCVRVARASTILAAAAAGVAALDVASAEPDATLFRLECEAAHDFGFHGRIATADWQQQIINEVFRARQPLQPAS